MLPVQVKAQLQQRVGIGGFHHAPLHILCALGHRKGLGEEVLNLFLADDAPGIGHADGLALLHGQPLELHVFSVLGLVLMPGKAPVVEDDGPGAIAVDLLLVLHFAVIVVGHVVLAAALISDGKRLGVQLARDEPACQLPGAAAPLDGDPGLVLVPALHGGAGTAALVIAHKVHHGVLPVGVLFKHGHKVRALGEFHGDLGIIGEVLAVLLPLHKQIAGLGPGQEGIGGRLRQIELVRLEGILRIHFRGLLALSRGDIAHALGVHRDEDLGLRQRLHVIALAALHLEQQAILPLFGDRDRKDFLLRIPILQSAV